MCIITIWLTTLTTLPSIKLSFHFIQPPSGHVWFGTFQIFDYFIVVFYFWLQKYLYGSKSRTFLLLIYLLSECTVIPSPPPPFLFPWSLQSNRWCSDAGGTGGPISIFSRPSGCLIVNLTKAHNVCDTCWNLLTPVSSVRLWVLNVGLNHYSK